MGSLILLSCFLLHLSPVMLVSKYFSLIFAAKQSFYLVPPSSLYFHVQCSYLVPLSIASHDMLVPCKSCLPCLLRNFPHFHCSSDPCIDYSVLLCHATHPSQHPHFSYFLLLSFTFFTSNTYAPYVIAGFTTVLYTFPCNLIGIFLSQK